MFQVDWEKEEKKTWPFSLPWVLYPSVLERPAEKTAPADVKHLSSMHDASIHCEVDHFEPRSRSQ